MDTFVGAYVRKRTRPRSAAETERLFRTKVRPVWGNRPLETIAKRDVVDLLDTVAATTPISANRVLAAVRRFFNWCVERDLLSSSPCSGVKAPGSETPRDRVLADHEVALVWLACGDIGPPFGPMVQLLLLTGQRLTEVAHMRWSEVDLTSATWTLPRERVKNNTRHIVPLSPTAVSVLTDIAGSARQTGLVFKSREPIPAQGGAFDEAPISGFSRAKQRLDRACHARLRKLEPDLTTGPSQALSFDPWVFHDLRRTLATELARLGVTLPVIEKVLNHTSGSFAGIVGVYQRHAYESEKRAALDMWADHVGALAATLPPGPTSRNGVRGYPKRYPTDGDAGVNLPVSR